MIEQLKIEITAKDKIIREYKAKIEKLNAEDSNNKRIINNLKNGLLSKEKIINDYSNQILNESRKSDNVIHFDSQEREKLLRNIEILKETQIKEINKYKEIIKQKETEIIRIQTIYNQNGINVYELQRIINELKKENSELNLKLKDYNALKEEIEYLYKRGGNYSFKETNKTSLKLAYDSLIEENKILKERIMQLENKRY